MISFTVFTNITNTSGIMKTSKPVTEIMFYYVLEVKRYFITEYPNNQHVYLLTSYLYLHNNGCIKKGRGGTEATYVQVPDFSAYTPEFR